jgi:hypothetical protein
MQHKPALLVGDHSQFKCPGSVGQLNDHDCEPSANRLEMPAGSNWMVIGSKGLATARRGNSASAASENGRPNSSQVAVTTMNATTTADAMICVWAINSGGICARAQAGAARILRR